jgi:hypothetical protein
MDSTAGAGSVTVAWSKFGCPICDVPSALHEDIQSMVNYVAHDEIDLWCWLPEWEDRWGVSFLMEVYAQHHDQHACLPGTSRFRFDRIPSLDESLTQAPH